MRSFLSFERTALALAVLMGTGGAARTQTTATPAAPLDNPAFVSPISPFLFGPPAYPFRATAPSSYQGAAPTSMLSSGIYRGPSLGSAITTPPPSSSLTYKQPAIGPFIGFASPLLEADALSSLPGSGYRPTPDNRAHVWLRVPADAEVWFDGKPTTQTGTLRLYNSPELPAGKKYHYEVRVRWTKDGKPREKKRVIEVEGRDWLRFDLTDQSEPRPQEAPKR